MSMYIHVHSIFDPYLCIQVIDMVKEETFVPRGRGGGRGGPGKQHKHTYSETSL